MSTQERLKEEFQTLNAPINVKILENCVKLCERYDLQVEDFMDLWLAYAASNSLPITPTSDHLDKIERTTLKESNELQTSKLSVYEEETIEEEPQTTITQLEDSFSGSFKTRPDAGTIIQSFGARDPETFTKGHSRIPKIEIENHNTENELFMFDTYINRLEALCSLSKWSIKHILEHHNLELSNYSSFQEYSSEMVICGRITSENNTRLNESNLMISCLPDLYKGHTLKLNINNVENARLFPGQNVVIRGKNMRKWFQASEIFTNSPFNSPPNPNLEENIQVMVAAGPFSPQENPFNFEPLEALIVEVLKTKPNLLILIGPFLDKQHLSLENLNQDCEMFFEGLIDGLMEKLKGSEIQVFLVPSPSDFHHFPVFPTIPFSLSKKYSNLHLVPNPFILNVEGVVIAGTATDVLFHLSKSEMTKGRYADRIGQLIKHLFDQRSMYPLYPADRDLQVDYNLLEEYGVLEESPHVMLLPSNLKHFVKTVENCVVLNPERLTKSNGGGNFARIEIKGGPQYSTIAERVICTIQRI